MAEMTIETTYANALYEAAQDTGKEDILLKEMSELKNLFLTEKELFEFIKTPLIAKEEKKSAITDIFKSNLSIEMLNFLYILVDKRRAAKFFKIVDKYSYLYYDSKNISNGEIYSAIPLRDEQVQSFNEEVSKLIGKNVSLVNKTDESIIGGIKIFVEGKVIDATIKERLIDMEEIIKQ